MRSFIFVSLVICLMNTTILNAQNMTYRDIEENLLESKRDLLLKYRDEILDNSVKNTNIDLSFNAFNRRMKELARRDNNSIQYNSF